MSRRLSKVCALALVIATRAAAKDGGAPVDGTWEPGPAPFRHINVGCRKQWICTPPPGFVPPEWTSNKTEKWTTGTCSAADGDIESCNECVAPPPKEKCQFK